MARADITPAIGIYARNWGAAKHDIAESIHRPLTLTALILAPLSGAPELVLVEADLGWWRTPELSRRFLDRLRENLATESTHLIFALAHTHAAPPLMEPEESLPGGGPLRSWMDQLIESATETVRKARETAFDGTLDWHAGRCGLASIRDFPEPDSDSDSGTIDSGTLQREIDWAFDTGVDGVVVALQLQGGLDGFQAIEKHLLKRRGLFPNTLQIQPVGWRLDPETRAEVDRLFTRLQTALRVT